MSKVLGILEKYLGDLDGEKAYFNPSPMELEACLNSTEWQFIRYIIFGGDVYIASGENYEHEQMARGMGITTQGAEEMGSIWRGSSDDKAYYSTYRGYNLEGNSKWTSMTRKLKPEHRNE